MKKCNVLRMFCIALAGIILPTALWASKSDNDFYKAIRYGAKADISVTVVDDSGEPVGNANISAKFDSAFAASGELKKIQTDTNGTAMVSGRTGKAVSFQVSKPGFYDSHYKICFVSMGQGAANGHWLPLEVSQNIILRKIKNPIATKPKLNGYKKTPITNEWLKFDLEYGDFVSPAGQGRVADFEVIFDWDGKAGQDYSGMSVKIRFVVPYSGCYYADKISCSDFSGVYCFDPSKQLSTEFLFYAKEERDPRSGHFMKRDAKLFDTTKNLVVRSRCKVDPETGALTSCNYSQISDISFGYNPGKIVFLVESFFNPTPNDTNLEPKQ